MINLKIDPEFQSQIPPLTDDEFKQLEENILKEGKLISPLIVWGNTLVDGHRRLYNEAKEMGLSTRCGFTLLYIKEFSRCLQSA